MSPRIAAVVAIAWIAFTLALHLLGVREHVTLLAGALGSSLQRTLGSASVIVHLLGALVVGPCVIAAALGAIADRVSRR